MYVRMYVKNIGAYGNVEMFLFLSKLTGTLNMIFIVMHKFNLGAGII